MARKNGLPRDETPSETATERAVRYLRDEIVAGRLAPGARIRQEAVSRAVGMSRIPVREALRKLETEGLVVLVAHSGARVPRLDVDEYTEIYKIREYLEPLAAAEAAVRATDQEVDHLRTLLRAMDEAVDDPGTWLDLDRRFHLASYASAGMPRLLRTVHGFWNSTQPYRRAFISTLSVAERETTRSEHLLLVDAFARRDPHDAEVLLRSHIRRTRLRLADRKELLSKGDAT